MWREESEGLNSEEADGHDNLGDLYPVRGQAMALSREARRRGQETQGT